MNTHSGQQKPNPRRKRRWVSGLGGLLAVVGLESTTEGITTGKGTERWRQGVSNFRGCNAETPSVK